MNIQADELRCIYALEDMCEFIHVSVFVIVEARPVSLHIETSKYCKDFSNLP